MKTDRVLPVEEPGQFKTSTTRDTLIVVAFAALAWQFVAWLTPNYLVPGWPTISASLIRLISQHPGWILSTAARVLLALLLSFLLGAGTASLLFFWETPSRYLLPLVRILMAVPVICWILFAVLWFRGTEFRIAFVLFIVSAPIFFMDLWDGMGNLPRDWLEMTRSLRPTSGQLFRSLVLPASLPGILTSWKINLSLAIRVVTIAELVGATSGIGYGLTVAQSNFSIADIFAWTLILILMLLASHGIVSLLERKMLRWRAVA